MKIIIIMKLFLTKNIINSIKLYFHFAYNKIGFYNIKLIFLNIHIYYIYIHLQFTKIIKNIYFEFY